MKDYEQFFVSRGLSGEKLAIARIIAHNTKRLSLSNVVGIADMVGGWTNGTVAAWRFEAK